MHCQSTILQHFTYGGAPVNFGSRVGPLFTSSGIPGINAETGVLPSSDAEQISNIFSNIAIGIRAAGGQVAQIAKLTVYVRDEAVREHVNREWISMFPDPERRPARNTFIYSFAPELAAMVDFIAYIPEEQ